MATKAQINANRANSQKSTGPKTEAGRAKSSRNRLSHGLCAALRLTPGEFPDDLNKLFADFYDEYHPATPTEQVLVERMVLSQWNFLRVFRYQTDAFTARPDQPSPVPFHLLLRYQTAADRGFFQAQKALLALRKERVIDEIGFESQTPAEPPQPSVETVETEPAEPAHQTNLVGNLVQPMPAAPKLDPTEGMTPEELFEFYEMDNFDKQLEALMTPEEKEFLHRHVEEMKKRAKVA